MRVVLVDDDPDDLWLLERAFQRSCPPDRGLAIKTYPDASQALDGIATTKRCGDTTPELILVDMNMPRVSGLEMIRELRRHPQNADISVVILTTADDRPLAAEARAAGAGAVLTKPDTMDGLVQLASDLIDTWLSPADLEHLL